MRRFEFFGSYNSIPRYILDAYTNATLAHSLMKLRKDYAGFAIRIIRDSDNAPLNVGFIGDDLDVSAITTFLGTSDGRVHTIYFQGLSGEGVDAVQTVKANMPWIATAGVIETLNGKPALDFRGNQFFDLGALSIFDIDQHYYSFVVNQLSPTTAGYGGLLTKSKNDIVPSRYSIFFGGAMLAFVDYTSGYDQLTKYPTSFDQVITSQHIKLPVFNEFCENMHTATTALPPTATMAPTAYHLFIGSYSLSGDDPLFPWYGKIQEVVAYYNDKEAVKSDIRNQINSRYGAY